MGKEGMWVFGHNYYYVAVDWAYSRVGQGEQEKSGSE